MAFSTPPDDDSRSAKGIILIDCVTAETAAALTGYNIQHVRRPAYDGKLANRRASTHKLRFRWDKVSGAVL